MTEVMNVLRERATENTDEKNEIYYTQKQKRVLKAIAENPHATAKEIGDIAEVHPSYVPYICERVDQGVVENLHRLEEYLSEREEMDNVPVEESVEEGTQEEQESDESEELMETFGAKPTVDDRHRVSQQSTEFTLTKQVPVEVTFRFPSGSELTKFMERDGDDEVPALSSD